MSNAKTAIKKNLAYIVLYLLALIPRAFGLEQTAVYPDEITWMVKGKETVYSLAKLDFNYFKYSAWWNSKTDTYAIGLPAVILNGIFHVTLAGSGKYSLKILPDIIASRIPLVLLGSLTTPLIYWFTKKLLNNQTAILASLSYAFSPIAIALDRWILHDSPKTLFTFMAVAVFLVAAKLKQKNYLSGFWLALSFLTKPTGLATLSSWFVVMLRKNTPENRKLFLGCGITFFLCVLALWPESWFHPIISIPEYLLRQAKLTRVGDPLPNFYKGEATFYPDWTYYFYQFYARTPEVVLAALVISSVLFCANLKRYLNAYSAGAIIYFCIFFAIISLTPQKGGIRYALPLLPWVYIASAWGWDKACSALKSKKKKMFLSCAYLVLSAYPLAYSPNYYLYYNSLVGGPSSAQKFDLVGLCYGTKQALEYIDREKIVGTAAIVGCADTAPYHTGRPLTKDWRNADIVVLESSYDQQFPQGEAVVAAKKRNLLKNIYQNGVVTAKIYK